jgi:hypothetical protein
LLFLARAWDANRNRLAQRLKRQAQALTLDRERDPHWRTATRNISSFESNGVKRDVHFNVIRQCSTNPVLGWKINFWYLS